MAAYIFLSMVRAGIPKNLDAQLNKISFVAGNRAPIARIISNKTVGAVPLTIQFSGETSEDLEGEELKYSWEFGDGLGTSSEINPIFTFDEMGDFDVKLTVVDPEGLKSETLYQIVAGNAPPFISVLFDSENTYYNSRRSLGYEIKVQDTEDGSLNNGISPNDVQVTLDFFTEGKKTSFCIYRA